MTFKTIEDYRRYVFGLESAYFEAWALAKGRPDLPELAACGRALKRYRRAKQTLSALVSEGPGISR